MAPPPGRLGDAVKLPVQVLMFSEEIAAVDAFAAALSQQSYGAAFSRTEALRIAAMEWLQERQAHRLPPRPPVVRGRSWRPSRPRGRRGSGLPRGARPPASL